jgi:hypothetical protein
MLDGILDILRDPKNRPTNFVLLAFVPIPLSILAIIIHLVVGESTDVGEVFHFIAEKVRLVYLVPTSQFPPRLTTDVIDTSVGITVITLVIVALISHHTALDSGFYARKRSALTVLGVTVAYACLIALLRGIMSLFPYHGTGRFSPDLLVVHVFYGAASSLYCVAVVGAVLIVTCKIKKVLLRVK